MPFNKESASRAGSKSSRLGKPNKNTQEIRDAYQMLIKDNLDNLSIWLEKIAEDDPVKAFDILTKLSEYVVPKLSRAEVRDVTDVEQLLMMSPQERSERIKEIQVQLEKKKKK